MITRLDLEERVREWGLREEVVEKDYALGWALWGIGSDEQLGTTWVFKGGTCLKKCYLETYRFSEDLDFTILPGGPIREQELAPIFARILTRVQDESGIRFDQKPPMFKTHPTGQYTEGRIYYQGPRGAPTVASIKLDLSASEKVVRPSVLRKISHPFPDALPEVGMVRCYDFDELFAEKIRAMGERSRPRDLYDIVNLFRRRDLQSHANHIRQVLVEKCKSKGVPVPTFEAIEASPHRSELETEWENMLAHQLPKLPPFTSFWIELPRLFQWLSGQPTEPELGTIQSDASEVDEAWAPPPTVSIWGGTASIEAIRFAAANHLCVNLGYNGSKRLIEPYALRRSKPGHTLLCAVKVQSRESRTYRVDRIQSVEVSQTPYKPVYRVELASSATAYVSRSSHPGWSAPAAPALPKRSARAARPGRTRKKSGMVYVYQCPWCDKTFKRTKSGSKLNPHKDPRGWPCRATTGYLVDTRYE